MELLKADEADVRIISALWPISPERPAHLFTQMVFLVEIIDGMPGLQSRPGDIAKRTRKSLDASGSALQWLTGTLLPLMVALVAFVVTERASVSTVAVTADVVVVLPALSVALAVKLWLPSRSAGVV